MSEQFTKLVGIMATLRAEGGCPWDRKQTHESLKPYLLEETYEVLETIDQGDRAKLREELGDVLLQVVFHSQIGAEAGTFTINDVLETNPHCCACMTGSSLENPYGLFSSLRLCLPGWVTK